MKATAFISAPRVGLLMRSLIWIADRAAGKSLLPARLMAWAPKVAITSGKNDVKLELTSTGEGKE